ncbi:MAG: hypothetical protein RLZZ127_1618 [Planctomycetota bacterium]|jgi:purine-binding chemotaxis protein CheW
MTAATWLTFLLGDDEYGVEILKVREIIGMLPITPVPGSPPSLDGVVNLRGRVIPVMNLRRRFGLAPSEPHPENVIIVVEGGSKGATGIAVDRVREVASFADADLEPPPAGGHDANCVAALGKRDGKVRILLDISHVLTAA